MKRMVVTSRVLLASVLLAGACSEADGDPTPAHADWRGGGLDSGGTIIVDPGDDEEDELGGDDGGGGRTGGDWIFNGIGAPSSPGVDPSHALSSPQGIDLDAWDDEDDGEGESDAQKLIRYVVQCALDGDDGVTLELDDGDVFLPGKVGLAPEWKDDSCDVECQQWVSACLLARVNAAGAEHEIFVQGDSPALGFGEDPAFPLFEGTFFGNVFTEPPVMHACQGDAAAATVAASIGRSCTLSESECGMTVHASCTSDAGCEVGPTGVATIDCQPVPGGTSYPGISVHIPES